MGNNLSKVFEMNLESVIEFPNSNGKYYLTPKSNQVHMDGTTPTTRTRRKEMRKHFNTQLQFRRLQDQDSKYWDILDFLKE